jgi:hypothetical protein
MGRRKLAATAVSVRSPARASCDRVRRASSTCCVARGWQPSATDRGPMAPSHSASAERRPTSAGLPGRPAAGHARSLPVRVRVACAAVASVERETSRLGRQPGCNPRRSRPHCCRRSGPRPVAAIGHRSRARRCPAQTRRVLAIRPSRCDPPAEGQCRRRGERNSGDRADRFPGGRSAREG